jgi:multisubunit Na+/H+ antiporter MnhE subunit
MSPGRAGEAGSALAALVLVYALTLGSFAGLDLLLGALIAALVLFALRGFLFAHRAPGVGELARRALGLPAFLLIVAREVLVGTWRVSVAVLRPTPAHVSGLVAVPMDERSDFGVAVSSIAISLTPGELVVDLDWERRVMLVHALDAADPKLVRDQQRHLYERYQRPVFP